MSANKQQGNHTTNNKDNADLQPPSTPSQRAAIVSGAGGGLGRDIARALAKEHYVVVINDLHQQQCDDTVNAITAKGGRAIAAAGNVGDENNVTALFDYIQATLGYPATTLINNAGIQTWSSLLDLSLNDWQNTLNTNLTGTFLMTQQFAKRLQNSRAPGNIINIGSGCNTRAFPKLVDYAASKGGIEMLTKTAALELGPSGIRVNCIAPGAIANERTAAETADYDASWSAITPLGRTGTPEDVANAVSLLCDDRASFISGQTINVDGGLFCQAIWPATY